MFTLVVRYSSKTKHARIVAPVSSQYHTIMINKLAFTSDFIAAANTPYGRKTLIHSCENRYNTGAAGLFGRVAGLPVTGAHRSNGERV